MPRANDSRKRNRERFQAALKNGMSLFSFFSSSSTFSERDLANDHGSKVIWRKYSNHAFSVAFSILLVALTANNLIFAFLSSDLFTQEMASISGIILLVVITITSFWMAQFLLLLPMSRATAGLRSKDRILSLLFKMMIICQYVLASLLIVLLVQTFFGLQYYAILIIGVLQLSFGMGTAISCFLAYKIFSWYRVVGHDKKRNKLGILLIALTITMLGIGTGLTSSVNSSTLFFQSPATIGIGHLANDNGNSNPTLLRNTFLPLRISFVLVWFSSSYLLRKYMKSFGRLKFWIVVTLPLATNLVAFFHSSLLPSFTIEDRIVLVLSSVAGGILISYSFLAISRSISDSPSDRGRSEVAGYMKMASYGTILLLVSLSSPVLFVFFPPFGVASWSLVGLAVFVFSIGIYAAAISVSEDARLRAAIRKSVISEPNFLDDFGTAQMGQNLQRRVLGIVEKERDILEKQTGVPPSLTEKEVEAYLDEVLREMKRNKRES